MTTVDGKQATFTVSGEYKDPMLLNGIVISSGAYARVFPQPQLFMVFIEGVDGATGDQQPRPSRRHSRTCRRRRCRPSPSTRTSSWSR